MNLIFNMRQSKYDFNPNPNPTNPNPFTLIEANPNPNPNRNQLVWDKVNMIVGQRHSEYDG